MSSLFRLIISQTSVLRCKTISQSGAFVANTTQSRLLSVAATYRCAAKEETPASPAVATEDNSKTKDIDRTKIITLEQSLRYLASDAYQQTYGEKLVWDQYRRNHKGGLPPQKTRKTCVRKGMISTGNPCPICRDEYLLLDHRNLELLKQFISPHTGEILSYTKTGLCQKKHQQLVIAIERAMDQGLLTFDVPFRQYNYAEYYEPKLLGDAKQSN